MPMSLLVESSIGELIRQSRQGQMDHGLTPIGPEKSGSATMDDEEDPLPMARLVALVLGLVLSFCLIAVAAAQNCVTRPDGLGGSRMTCSDGSSATTRPDGLGGSRTLIQPPPQPYPQPYGQPQQPQTCTTRPDGLGGLRTTCF
jgi:hypothetical protein